jgi:NTP pyrophosphatase (non-canonical NTP hydrolase)
VNKDTKPFTLEQYQTEAQVTKSPQFNVPLMISDTNTESLVPHTGTSTTDILHAIIGISTEAGELLDPVKKMMFYGKPLDPINLDEEIGDILWYIAIYATARATTILKLAETNSLKLRIRYPEKFTYYRALHRDLKAEREVLESGSKKKRLETFGDFGGE